MDLVRDFLDKRVVDRHGRDMGRADSVILEISAHAPPVVTAIEVSPAVLARRVHPLLGRWMGALEYALGIAGGRPLRIPYRLLMIRDQLTADLAFGETPAAALEHRLRGLISRIPGSS